MGTDMIGDTKYVFGKVESLIRTDRDNCERLFKTNFRSISGRGQRIKASADRLLMIPVTDVFE
jgi:hypothetical protein